MCCAAADARLEFLQLSLKPAVAVGTLGERTGGGAFWQRAVPFEQSSV